MTRYAIVPAAGRSQRMGRPKLLLPWRNGTIIEQVLAAWRDSDVDHVIAVVHPADEQLAAICRRAGASVVVPAPPPPEMKDSVAAALRHIAAVHGPTPEDAWLLSPADMPTLSTRVINRLIAADQPPPQILVPTHNDRRGHPVLFPWALANEVLRLGPDEGVNALLARHTVREIACPREPLAEDADTPEQYRQLRERDTT